MVSIVDSQFFFSYDIKLHFGTLITKRVLTVWRLKSIYFTLDLKINTVHSHYKDHLENAVEGNNHCVLEEYTEHIHTYNVQTQCRVLSLKLEGACSIIGLKKEFIFLITFTSSINLHIHVRLKAFPYTLVNSLFRGEISGLLCCLIQ